MSNRSEHCVHEQSNDHHHTKLINAEEEFITSRERLKAKFRKEMAQERAFLFGNTTTSSPSTCKANCTNKSNNYGTFFGPLVPSVATRVVEERMAVRAQSSTSSQKKRTARYLSENKNSTFKKMKIAAQLRYTRDFSFLFSEDDDGTKLSTDSKYDDASSKQQPPPSKSSTVAPSKDHRVKPTSRTDNRNVSHAAQRKGADHQRAAGTYKQSLPQCNKRTPALASPRIGHYRSKKKQGILADTKPRRPAKRPFDEDDHTDAIRIIRGMFKYDPSKWEGKEEEDDIMEVNFDAIMREERRSARIAKDEDDEQLQLLLQEEKQKKKKIRLN